MSSLLILILSFQSVTVAVPFGKKENVFTEGNCFVNDCL